MVELACDGAIMDMAYCPSRLVISTYIYTNIMLVKMLYIALYKKVVLSIAAEICIFEQYIEIVNCFMCALDGV